MERISSGQTFFVKRILPWLWLVAVGIVAALPYLVPPKPRNPAVHAPSPEMFLIVPVMMFGLGAVLFRKLIWDLADEVDDYGDHLRARRRGIEERVKLVDVINVNMSQLTNPPRLTLRLRKPWAFGDEMVFIPKAPAFRLNPFARNAIAENLIRRVDEARISGGTKR
jgi:hypothetical protein